METSDFDTHKPRSHVTAHLGSIWHYQIALIVTQEVTNQIAFICQFPLMPAWSSDTFHAQFHGVLISIMKSSLKSVPRIRPVCSTHGSLLLNSTSLFFCRSSWSFWFAFMQSIPLWELTLCKFGLIVTNTDSCLRGLLLVERVMALCNPFDYQDGRNTSSSLSNWFSRLASALPHI